MIRRQGLRDERAQILCFADSLQPSARVVVGSVLSTSGPNLNPKANLNLHFDPNSNPMLSWLHTDAPRFPLQAGAIFLPGHVDVGDPLRLWALQGWSATR